TIVVAAKTFGVQAIREVTDAGARDVGENYVQEAMRKIQTKTFPGVRWHLIGRLQRNKAKQAVRLFDLIHSVDRVELAEELDSSAAAIGKRVPCLIEVNLAGEPSKGGIRVNALRDFLETAASFPRLEIRGLMAIPPPRSTQESRRSFARLRALRDD